MIFDEEIKRGLLESKEALFSGEENSALLKVMREKFPEINVAFILDWIPEQAEDIYWVLIDVGRVAIIEVPRSAKRTPDGPLVEVRSIENYNDKKLSKRARRKLKVALDLICLGV